MINGIRQCSGTAPNCSHSDTIDGTDAAVSGNALRFAVLGPLEVRRGDVDHTPRTPKPAHLLAVLLLNANLVVPLGELVDELWPTPPRLAKKTIQTYVYQLRRELGQWNEGTSGPLIETHQNGYQIRLHRSQLDLWTFHDLVEDAVLARGSGDDRCAAMLFRKALDIWRGSPLSNIEFGLGVAARVSALEDRRLEVLEKRIDTDLALGRHRSLVGELKGITTQYPLHEVFCVQLMTAALRSGLRGDALGAYQRLRKAMVDELGLEPSARLRRLQQEALDSSPATDPAPGAMTVPAGARPPAQLPPDIADFVGREHEVASLIEQCGRDELAHWPGAAILLVGAPGIGKTVLAVHTAQRLRGRFPGGQLYAGLHDSRGAPVEPGPVLASFLRALGARPEDVPYELDERASMFRTWARGRRLLIVFDDAASGEQLVPLLPSCDGCTAIVTARHRIPELSFLYTLELEPVTVDEGVELLAQIVGASRIGHQLSAAREVVERCDRLPLAVRIAGQKLVSQRGWPVRTLADRLADRQRRLAELSIGRLDIRAYLGLVCDRLSVADRGTLVALARLGPGWFNLSAAAGALHTDSLTAEGLVGTLVNENLLRVTGFGHGGGTAFQFPELVRLYATHHLAAIGELVPEQPEQDLGA